MKRLAWAPMMQSSQQTKVPLPTHSHILAWRIPWTKEPGGLRTVHAVAKSRTRLATPPVTASSSAAVPGRLKASPFKRTVKSYNLFASVFCPKPQDVQLECPRGHFPTKQGGVGDPTSLPPLIHHPLEALSPGVPPELSPTAHSGG